MTPPDMPMAPQQIGRYELHTKIGQGGMASIYQGYDPRFRRTVAIKLMPSALLADETFLARFEQEAQTIAALEHSAIVPVYDFGEHEGQPYLIMRYMAGGTLADLIAQQGGLPLAETARIIERVAAALDWAHLHGVIHRDVKPSNILFDEARDVYLGDFGIVKLTEATARLTGSGIVGTPTYMAPEMVGPGGVTPLIDVYALGVTLYEMLTGRLPFEADTPMGVLMAHVASPVPDIRALRPDLPGGVQYAIDQAMAKDPTQRYQQASALAVSVSQAVGEAAQDTELDQVTVAISAPPATRAVDSQAAPIDDGLPDAIAAPDSMAHDTISRRKRQLPGWVWRVGGVAVVALVVGILAILRVLGGGGTAQVEPTLTGAAAVANDTPTSEPSSTPAPTATLEPANTPTLEPTLDPVYVQAEQGVASNSAWTPYIEGINSVEMALVPAGCFRMGSERGFKEETPEHEVCFEEPFWIDVYEVTNKQYGSTGCEDTASNPDQPRNCVNWMDALAHCEAHGARLPTEAEWEYAARGPDSLLFPWGNEFWGDNVVYLGTSGRQTAEVGSKPGGISWVGALDMSGNVWEWVNDWYSETYYQTLPERVLNPQGPESGNHRVVRGGGWNVEATYLRATVRGRVAPIDAYGSNGFRCALSYQP